MRSQRVFHWKLYCASWQLVCLRARGGIDFSVVRRQQICCVIARVRCWRHKSRLDLSVGTMKRLLLAWCSLLLLGVQSGAAIGQSPPATTQANPPQPYRHTGETAADGFWFRIENRQRRCASELYFAPSISSEISADRFLACLNSPSESSPRGALPAEIFRAAVGLIQGSATAGNRRPLILRLVESFPANARSQILAIVQQTCLDGSSAISMLLAADYFSRFPPSSDASAVLDPRCYDKAVLFGMMLRFCETARRNCIETGFDYVMAVRSLLRRGVF